MSSWAPKTLKQYDSSLRKWAAFCRKRGVDGENPSTIDLVNYLSDLHQDGLGFSSVSTGRAAVTSYLKALGKFNLDEEVLARTMKGIFRLKPTVAKYSEIWSVNDVIAYIRTMGDTANLSLEALTKKLVMLMALTSPKRVSEIAKLRLDSVQLGQEKWVFHLNFMNKNRGMGKAHTAVFEKFEETNLCPVRTMEEYLIRTKDMRQGEKTVVLSYVKPHKPVTSTTIARWLKQLLTKAGIGCNYGAHSIRAASTSKGMAKGLSSKTIMAAANWAPSSSVFEKFYHREIREESYQKAVLDDRCVEEAIVITGAV